jgi:ABC-type multidrug transport system ATPase subunit
MDEAALCDRVSLIQSGHILQTGTPRNIVQSFSRNLFSIKGEDKSGLIRELRMFEKSHSVFLFGQDIHFTGIDNTITPAEVKEYLRNKGFEDIEVEKIQPGIEDCFMDLMKN